MCSCTQAADWGQSRCHIPGGGGRGADVNLVIIKRHLWMVNVFFLFFFSIVVEQVMCGYWRSVARGKLSRSCVGTGGLWLEGSLAGHVWVLEVCG